MGISGEVFRKSHYKFENGLDKLVGNGQKTISDGDSTDHSLISRLRSLPQANSRLYNHRSRMRKKEMKNIELEEIMEDNP